MENKNCLNCGVTLTGKFCAQCGQKADTHRITAGHFFMHDLLHGFWHLDKGILYTLKQTFIRPGLAAMDYIGGKRTRYYNVFYLTLIILGLNLLVVHYIHKYNPPKVADIDGDGLILYQFITENIKYIILCLIPLFALNGFILFRKLKLNYAEHMIIAGFALLGCTVIALVVNLLSLGLVHMRPVFWENIKSIQDWMCILFPVWVYYLATRIKYKVFGFTWRMLLFYLLFPVEIILAVILGIIIINGGNFEGKFMI